MTKPSSVLFVAAEVTPLAKVGGLADVVGALPIALRRRGIDARIIMPGYGVIDRSRLTIHKRINNVSFFFRGNMESVNVSETTLPNSDVPVYLIENARYFGGDRIYFDASAFVSQFVEFERFLFFGLSIPAILPKLSFLPDLVHCHDWHTGIVPALLGSAGRTAARPATVFTIHNLANQGKWNAREIISCLGPAANNNQFFQPDDRGDLNLLAIGLKSADLINTVSPQYAEEILTPEFGEGLQSILASRADSLTGILNGIDVERFNPSTDQAIPVRYDANSFAGKLENKLALQKVADLRVAAGVPLFGFIGRLTDQKGMDLLGQIFDQLVENGGQLVILGTGLEQFKQIAQAAAQRHPDAIHTTIGFDATFAQLIYAGSDFFLMPSRFEPCGLGQMIAMRYGTIPIVRATGGLKDTVPDYTLETAVGRGFTFADYSAAALWSAITKGLALYQDKDRFTSLARRIMTVDFSWDLSSQSYTKLYASARAKHKT